MAAYLRSKFPLPLVAVTGSNGKSTTKEMIASIFSVSRPTLKNPGNYNNLVGLPLTLFRLNDVHQVAVVELGMNQAGEIKRLSEICQPDVAVITNIGPVHLQGLKTLDGVAEAKKEILDGLKESGIVVYNANDEYCRKSFSLSPYQTVSFGLDNPEADIRGKVFHQGGPRGLSAIIDLGEDAIPVKLHSCGYHNLENALAAAAATKSLGADAADIKAGLEEFKPLERRSQFCRLRGGIEILDDSYNANPRSMEMSFRLLQDIGNGRRKLALLADMCELGEYAEDAHRQLGRQVAQSGFERLVYLGSFGEIVADGAIKEGMPDKAIFLCPDHDQACQVLTQLLEEGDLLLVKASRAMALEKVVDTLAQMLGSTLTN
jgi:UDP-N-acetylmuramoyl-tripeptide--D-alanyl-D-alanine ligase